MSDQEKPSIKKRSLPLVKPKLPESFSTTVAPATKADYVSDDIAAQGELFALTPRDIRARSSDPDTSVDAAANADVTKINRMVYDFRGYLKMIGPPGANVWEYACAMHPNDNATRNELYQDINKQGSEKLAKFGILLSGAKRKGKVQASQVYVWKDFKELE